MGLRASSYGRRGLGMGEGSGVEVKTHGLKLLLCLRVETIRNPKISNPHQTELNRLHRKPNPPQPIRYLNSFLTI